MNIQLVCKHSRITQMAKNHSLTFSLMMMVMALFLQSQSGGCCNTPNPPSQTPTAEGVLYLPKLQPPNVPSGGYPNPTCNGIPVYQQVLPNGNYIYPIDVDFATQTNVWYFKVKVTSVDGCYIENTYLNANNRTALSGKGIKVRYPIDKPYVIEVWAQVCGYCVTCWLPTDLHHPEWYCKFASSDNNWIIFGNGNPYNLTFHSTVVNTINFAMQYGGNGNGSIEPKFKFNGSQNFGVNVFTLIITKFKNHEKCIKK